MLAITLLLSYYVLVQKSRARKDKLLLAPEASGAWPIIGHLLLLGRKNTLIAPHRTLGIMADMFGDVFNIRLGMQRVLVVSSSKIAKECFTVNDAAILSRPKQVAIEHMGYNYASFAFGPYGPYWREIRKITTVNLLSNQRLEMLKHIRISEVSSFMKELYNDWKANKDESDGLVLEDLKQCFQDLSLNIILRVVVGKRYCFKSNKCDDDKETKRIQKAIRDFFHLVGLFVPGDFFPYLRWLDLGGYEKNMINTAKELDFFLEKWLEEHKQQQSNHQDFMAQMISILQSSHIPDFDDDTITKSTVLVSIQIIKLGFSTLPTTLVLCI